MAGTKLFVNKEQFACDHFGVRKTKNSLAGMPAEFGGLVKIPMFHLDTHLQGSERWLES